MEWICTHCRRSIEDGDGYIALDHRRAIAVAAERRKLDREHDREHESQGLTPIDWDRLWERPRRVEWFATHRRCDPDLERADYWIDVERCRTLGELLDWNRHIHAKTWAEATNWDQFILDAAS